MKTPTVITRLWHRYVSEPLAWVDREATLPPGRVSPETRCTIVLLVGALVLSMMSYAVLSRPHQNAVVTLAMDWLATMDPALAADAEPYRPLLRILTWSLGAFTMYFVIPALIITRVFGHSLRDYGMSMRGVKRHLWVYGVLFIPVAALVLAVAQSPEFQAKYPFYREPIGATDFIVWELFYALQFFSLEFFFRGFLIHGVKDKMGRYAIFAMVIPYTMIHFSKPFYESIGAIIAGSVLGLLSLRTGSIFGGWIIHVGVAVLMDIAALSLRQ